MFQKKGGNMEKLYFSSFVKLGMTEDPWCWYVSVVCTLYPSAYVVPEAIQFLCFYTFTVLLEFKLVTLWIVFKNNDYYVIAFPQIWCATSKYTHCVLWNLGAIPTLSLFFNVFLFSVLV